MLGVGQNAFLPLVPMMIVLRGGSVRTTQALSAMAQSVGYALAALAPLAVCAIHGLTHSWTPVVILLLVLLVPQLLLGLGAGRPRTLSAAEASERAARPYEPAIMPAE
jgi:CP family cyanate transporter-like MFS transporter